MKPRKNVENYTETHLSKKETFLVTSTLFFLGGNYSNLSVHHENGPAKIIEKESLDSDLTFLASCKWYIRDKLFAFYLGNT